MKIELDYTGINTNRIESYSKGQIRVNGETYHSSLVIAPDSIQKDILPENFGDLTKSHIESIQPLSPEVLIIGTGQKLLFPDEDILSPLINNQTGYEIMDTGAACRSFNFLIGEGRVVVLAVFML